jgi:hypothetical protein
MGTVQIEWPDVTRLESAQEFIVEDTDGNLLYGHIAADPQAGFLTVAGADRVTRRVPMTRAARLSQSEDRLLEPVHGSFALGFDYPNQSYDSNPPDATAGKADYGAITSLGYSF